MSYQLYRNTIIGQTLQVPYIAIFFCLKYFNTEVFLLTYIPFQDSLYELVQYGQIPPSLANDVLLHFDKSVNDALSSRVSDDNALIP